jgi:hypothetical protein
MELIMRQHNAISGLSSACPLHETKFGSALGCSVRTDAYKGIYLVRLKMLERFSFGYVFFSPYKES